MESRFMARVFNLAYKKDFRRSLRSHMPQAEVILWSKLQRRQLGGYKFRRQYGVGKYIVDFYCPKLKLAIEIDGPSHFVEGAKARDEFRQKYIEGFGIRVVRFTNEDVRRNLYGVLARLGEVIEERKRAWGAKEGEGGDPLRS